MYRHPVIFGCGATLQVIYRENTEVQQVSRFNSKHTLIIKFPSAVLERRSGDATVIARVIMAIIYLIWHQSISQLPRCDQPSWVHLIDCDLRVQYSVAASQPDNVRAVRSLRPSCPRCPYSRANSPSRLIDCLYWHPEYRHGRLRPVATKLGSVSCHTPVYASAAPWIALDFARDSRLPVPWQQSRRLSNATLHVTLRFRKRGPRVCATAISSSLGATDWNIYCTRTPTVLRCSHPTNRTILSLFTPSAV
ncbi:hypothetical protein JB92DRAFT_1226314 [Gautieria morchelliformis]|nr:hypothetical protein JB92DRAFT_1226314 [Gautieria morchelliformis]